MKKYKEFLFENNTDFHEGDRVIVTKRKSKFRNQTGTITFLEELYDTLMIEVTLDYIDKVISVQKYDIDKIDPLVKISEEDPYGEEDWSEDYM